MRAKAKAARHAMTSEAATAPTVRIELLANRTKNFSPASAASKFLNVMDTGSPHLFAIYSDFVLNADTVMK